MPIDWTATDRRAIASLRQHLCPINYRQLYGMAVAGVPDDYGPKTDPVEKFRQRYAERDNRPIIILPGGDLALDYWFPFNHQPQLITAYPSLKIERKASISFDIGYEFANREPYLFDHYNDGASEERHLRRKSAYLFEEHVRDYYRSHWPQFYAPPSNKGKYDKGAKDDFSIHLPDGLSYLIDTKTESFEEDGQGQAYIRRLRKNIIYIVGIWEDKTESAIVKGIISGKWLITVAGLYCFGDFIASGQLMSYEVLNVILNMAEANTNYVNAFYATRDRICKNRWHPRTFPTAMIARATEMPAIK